MELLNILSGWLFLIIGLAISIGLHELGHLLPAKKFGVKVTKYMIGFGPTLFSRKRGETEYGIKAIPLGGYIQMVGMLPPEQEGGRVNAWTKFVSTVRQSDVIAPEDDSRAFYHLKPWQKLIIMFGGPFANLLIAILLALTLFSGFGVYDRTSTVKDIVACIPTETNPDCSKVGEPSPSSLAGLKAGDKILSFDGIAVTRWSDVDAVLAKKIDQPVALVVERAGEKLNLTITPAKLTTGGTSRAYLGVYLDYARFQQSPAQAMGNLGIMLSGTAEMIVQLPVQAAQAVGELVPGSPRSSQGAISIVGLGQYSGDLAASSELSFQEKVLSQLSLLMSLNVALFVFNMVPLVPLDGGHIAGAIYESLKRGIWRIRGKKLTKPVDTGLMMPVAYFVGSLLLVLSVVLILRDILNPMHF